MDWHVPNPPGQKQLQHQGITTTFTMQETSIFRGPSPTAAHLGLGDGFMHFVRGPDLLQHVQHGLVCASVGGAPQGRNAGCYAGEGVGLAGPCMGHATVFRKLTAMQAKGSAWLDPAWDMSRLFWV